jgi:hypothetical protein
VVSIPSHRPVTRRSSASNQYEDAPLGDKDFDWSNFDSWISMEANPNNDAGQLRLDQDFAFLSHPAEYNEFGGASDLTSLPDTARRSVSLLQRPFSTMPGTPQDMHFNHALSPPNSFFPQQGAADISLPMYTKEVTHVAPIPVQSTHWVSDAQAEAQMQGSIFRDNYSNYPSEGHAHMYPDPIQSMYGTQHQPYYNDTSLYQTYGTLDQFHVPYTSGQVRESYLIDDRSRKRLRSQPLGTVPERQTRHSHNAPQTRSLSYRSDSSYPSRSTYSAAEEYMRAPQPMGDDKRKSVVNQRNIYVTKPPKLDMDKPWIRINKTTKGKTTRTAKVNDFDPSAVYRPRPHPLGNRNSGRYDFRYTTDGEWKDLKMPAAAIRDFILRYPEDVARGIKLKLMIQVTPTDSARRYLSQSWTKCRFAECPMHQNGGSGTILHGHYRVAFDERTFSSSREDPYDPHLAAGAYVHLYCFERFLDLEEICRKAHIHADARVISQEPRGNFAASLAGHPEYETAHKFIKEAMKKSNGTYGNVRNIEGWENYPRHKDYMGDPKPHEDTLVYRMHATKALSRPPAQMKQFQARGIGPTHLLFNHGDLNLYMEAVLLERATKVSKKAKKRRIQDILSGDEEEDEARVEFRKKIRHLAANVEKKYNLKTLTPIEKSAPEQTKRTTRKPRTVKVVDDSDSDAPRRATRTKRKAPAVPEPWNVSDSDSDDDFQPYKPSVTGFRRSPRVATSAPKDYREIEEPLLHQQKVDYLQNYMGYNFDPPGYEPASSNLLYIPQQQNETHQQNPVVETRRDSLPIMYSDPNLEGIDFDAFFQQEGLDRRSSSVSAARRASLSTHHASILRSAMSPVLSRHTSLGSKRHASFSKQPVSHQCEFDIEAPPREVEMTPTPPRTRTRTRSQVEKDRQVEQKHKEVLSGVKGGRVGKTRRGPRYN